MSGKEQKFDDIKCVGRANGIFISLLDILGPVLDRRAGGYLVVADHKGLPVFLDRLGEIPEDKLNQYYTNALEKARRLAFASRFAGHMLSRQSRDENRQQWIGAVLGGLWIWSFSGFPEDCDEIFMFTLALGCGDISYDKARGLLRVGSIAQNPHLRKVDGLLRNLAGIH